MANQIISRTAIVTASDVALNATKLVVGHCEITCPTDNTGNVTFTDDDSNTAEWEPGEWKEFNSIDLNKILIKGTAGDKVTIVGDTGGRK